MKGGIAGPQTEGAALADPGNAKGWGQGQGGGDIRHVDSGNHTGTAKGEGRNKNPHNDGDATAPETTVDSLDTSNVTTDGSVVAHFSSNEPGGTFECKRRLMNELGEELNQPPFDPCTSPKTYNDLGWYSYRFYVRATDAAGNVDETPATQVFEAKIDSIPPDGEITDGPADGAVLNQSSVTYSFQVSDNRDIQQTGCVVYDNATGFPYTLPTDDPNGLPSGEKRVCFSPVTFENIPDGNYTFALYPQDRTFTTDPTPATRTFTVDTTVA